MLIASTVVAQDPGRPIVPGPGQGQIASAYFHNNTWRPVRFVVSSANGTTTGVVAAGFYEQFTFVNDNKPRILSVFDMRGGEIVSSREIDVNPNCVYTARWHFGTMPVPGGPGVARAAERDRGQPAKPGEMRNVVPIK
jgi:hypothetical protein